MAAAFQTYTTDWDDFGGGTGNSSPAVPTGTASGDALTLYTVMDNGTDLGSIATATGFTQIIARTIAGTGSSSYPSAKLQGKVASGSESAPSVAVTEAYETESVYIRANGTHASTPFGNTATSTLIGPSTSHSFGSVSIANAGSLGLIFTSAYGGAAATTWGSAPTGTTAITTYGSSGYAPYACAYEARNAGSWAPASWTTTESQYTHVSFTLELIPAAGGGGTTYIFTSLTGAGNK